MPKGITRKQARALFIMQRRGDWENVVHDNTTYSLIRRGLVVRDPYCGDLRPSEAGKRALEEFEAQQTSSSWWIGR